MSKIDKDTDFFAYVDNFAKYQHVESVRLYGQHKAVPPKVSITIPTYRRPELLKEAVESAINQDGYEDYEIIIVDNDITGEFAAQIIEMLKSFASDKVVYYRNQENIGMFGNWNRCIELATGEWMTILNDDDVLFKHYLISMTSNYKTANRIECCHRIFQCEDELRFCKNLQFSNNTPLLKMSTYFVYILDNFNGCQHSILFQIEKGKLVGGFNSDFYPSADYVFNAMYAFYFKEVYRLDQKLCGYRVSVGESLKPSTKFGFFRIYYLFGHFLLQKKSCISAKVFYKLNCIYRIRMFKGSPPLKVLDLAHKCLRSLLMNKFFISNNYKNIKDVVK